MNAYDGYLDVVQLEPPDDRQVEVVAYVEVDCEDLKAQN